MSDHALGETATPACSFGHCRCHMFAEEEAHAHSGMDNVPPWLYRIILPGILFVLGLVAKEWLVAHLGTAAWYALMLAAYLLCGLPVLKEAFEALRDRDFFNEFTLMGSATLTAILLGDLSEAVGVMLFYAIGEAVQDEAACRSRRSIKSLVASKPDHATLMRDGKAVVVNPETVAVGSSILVKPGEKVPLDGVIVSGSASVDQSSLTGESIPVAKAAGEEVYSGSICLDGDLVIRTTAG